MGASLAVLLAAVGVGEAPATASPAEVRHVIIDTSRSEGVHMQLNGGVYTAVVTGAYEYALDPEVTSSVRFVADPECTTTSSDPIFARHRYGSGETDPLDVTANGFSPNWLSVSGSPTGCDPAHTYRFSFAASGPQNVRWSVQDVNHVDNLGFISLEIVDGCLSGPCQPLPNCGLLYCEPPCDPLAKCLPLASGTADRSSVIGPIPPDVECLPITNCIPPLPPQPPVPPCFPITNCIPPIPPPPPPLPCNPPSGCVPDDLSFLPDTPYSTQLVQLLRLDAASSDGATTRQPVRKGRAYEVVVTGVYRYDSSGALADAECSTAPGGTEFAPHRFGTGQLDALDVTLNGFHPDPWAAVLEPIGGPTCDPTHTYRLSFVAADDAIVNFKISDPSRHDNAGALLIALLNRPTPRLVPNPGAESLIGAADWLVDSADPIGPLSANPLKAGTRYTFTASGFYDWGGGLADAECSTGVLADGDVSWAPHRFDHIDGRDLLDLEIAGFTIEWTPATAGAVGPCDPSHNYIGTVVPSSTAYVSVRVLEAGLLGFADNVGVLPVTAIPAG